MSYANDYMGDIGGGGGYNDFDAFTFATGGNFGIDLPGGDGGGGGGFQIPDIDIGIGIGGGGGGGGVPSVNQTLTQLVNGYEYQLKQNLAQWQQGQKTADNAVGIAWQLMNAMVAGCLQYGAQGQKSAAERDRRINPSMLRWDWILYYIDPITGGNTPLPPVPGGGLNTSLQAGMGDNVWMIAALLLVLYLANRD